MGLARARRASAALARRWASAYRGVASDGGNRDVSIEGSSSETCDESAEFGKALGRGEFVAIYGIACYRLVAATSQDNEEARCRRTVHHESKFCKKLWKIAMM